MWINRTSAMYPHPKRDRVRAALLKRYGAPTLDEERTLAWFWDEGGKLDAAGAGKTLNRHPCVLQQGNPPASCRRQLIISLTAGESKDSVRQMTISYGDAYGEREGKRQSSKFDADAHKAQQEEAGASAELPDL